MKYVVRKSVVCYVGTIWQGLTCAQDKTLSSYDVENMRDDDGKITRESVENWLGCNSGDFQSIDDFYASIEDGDETIDIEWASEESEMTYNDCMFPSDD